MMKIVSELNDSERRRIRAAFDRAGLQCAGKCFRVRGADGDAIGLYSLTRNGQGWVSLLGQSGPGGRYHDVWNTQIEEVARRHFATEGKL